MALAAGGEALLLRRRAGFLEHARLAMMQVLIELFVLLLLGFRFGLLAGRFLQLPGDMLFPLFDGIHDRAVQESLQQVHH